MVLVPQPSDDPNDPLRLPLWRKWAAFISIVSFCAIFSFNINGIAPALFEVSQDFKISPTDTSVLLTWCVLGAGLGVSLTPEWCNNRFDRDADSLRSELCVGAGRYLLRPTAHLASHVYNCVLLCYIRRGGRRPQQPTRRESGGQHCGSQHRSIGRHLG